MQAACGDYRNNYGFFGVADGAAGLAVGADGRVAAAPAGFVAGAPATGFSAL